jgi:hypothetical protein
MHIDDFPIKPRFFYWILNCHSWLEGRVGKQTDNQNFKEIHLIIFEAGILGQIIDLSKHFCPDHSLIWWRMSLYFSFLADGFA